MKINTLINRVSPEVKLPKLHGHTKIVLTDIHTGEEEVIEKDNIVTDWMKLFYGRNLFQLMKNEEIYPMINFFNGVEVINTPITEATEADIAIPAGSDVIAHAGNIAYAGVDPTAGNPNIYSGSYITRDGANVGYNFVWDWASSNGNGVWNAVCLTHGILGYLGRNAFDPSVPPIHMISNKQTTNITSNNILANAAYVDFEHNIVFDIVDDKDSEGLIRNLTIKEYDFTGLTYGLFSNDVKNEENLIRTFEIPFSTFRAFGVQVIGDYLYLSNIGTYSVIIKKVNIFTGEAESTTYNYSGVEFLSCSSFVNRPQTKQYRINLTPIVGDYIFVPATDGGMYKCSLSNTADVKKITKGEDIPEETSKIAIKSQQAGCIITEQGNLIYSNFTVINDVMIPNKVINEVFFNNNYNFTFGGGFNLGGGVYLVKTLPDYTNDINYFLAIAQDSISTFNILETPVTKTPDKTAKLSYSIQVEEE